MSTELCYGGPTKVHHIATTLINYMDHGLDQIIRTSGLVRTRPESRSGPGNHGHNNVQPFFKLLDYVGFNKILPIAFRGCSRSLVANLRMMRNEKALFDWLFLDGDLYV